MTDWLHKISDFFISLIKSFFTALLDFVHDAVVWVLDQILTAIAALITAIPTPTFMQGNNNFGTLLGGLPPFALYVVNQMHIGDGFAIIGSGVIFYLARKLFTLGQW